MNTASRTIPFFNYPALYRQQEKEILSLLHDVMSRGAFIMQKDLLEFETTLAKYLGVKHAFGVADGTNAILMGLLAAGLQPGDEVIVPTHTFIATAAAVHWAGGVPVLADCGPDKMIDPTSAEACITPKTRFLMPVQLNGRTADMDALTDIAKRHGLKIVEDSAQALGSKYKGRSAGTFGEAGTLSFYPAKLLGCFGDGGAVMTNDDKVAAQIHLLRDHGRDPEGIVRRWGLNSRLDNMQAAVLNLKFKTFDQDVARRRAIASLYQERLGKLDQVLLPPAPDSDPNHFDVFQNYEIEADDRNALRAHLDSRGVKTILQWGGHGIHQFKDLGFKTVPPYAERMFQRELLLPMNTTLSDEDVHYISDTILEFYKA
ncbi:DegT/DnrJ/EryC1/StrS family aminotransferase [bacterium]|nr:DegT/DnrJ/EryC1/StrS family aminotransferase [bacterium]